MNSLNPLLVLCLLGPGCVSFDYGPSPFSCTRSEACPEGYRCVDQRCLAAGIARDAIALQWADAETRLDGDAALDGGTGEDAPSCNGDADADCPCTPGAERPCGSAVGSCLQGTRTCGPDGAWGGCEGAVGPAEEICDDEDNDCDGKADDALLRDCYTGPAGTEAVGLCRGGRETCEAGAWGICLGEVTPKDERCNAADDDCDGEDDNGLCPTGEICAFAAGCQSATATGDCKVGAGWQPEQVQIYFEELKEYTFKNCKLWAEGYYDTTLACGAKVAYGTVVYQEATWKGLVWHTKDCP